MEETMAVRVIEMGNRPAILTAARRLAPQAARMAGELLGQLRFGDAAFAVLDWDDELGQQPGDLKRPILYLQVQKGFPDGQRMSVESRLDVDDVFVSDSALSRDILIDLIRELEEKVNEQTARWAAAQK